MTAEFRDHRQRAETTSNFLTFKLPQRECRIFAPPPPPPLHDLPPLPPVPSVLPTSQEAAYDPKPPPPATPTVVQPRTPATVMVCMRPRWRTLLRSASQKYVLVCYTHAEPEYARKVLQHVDPDG